MSDESDDEYEYVLSSKDSSYEDRNTEEQYRYTDDAIEMISSEGE